MAWTEKYVDLADGGAGDGSSGDPWASYGEAISELGALAGPTKIYVRGSQSLDGSVAFSNDGTAANPIWWIGCTGTGATWTPIGNDASATKPTLTLTVTATNQVTVTGDYQTFDGLAFTTAVSTAAGGTVYNTSAGAACVFIRCRMINTKTASTSSCGLTVGGTASLVIGCYVSATGGATHSVNVISQYATLFGNHISGGDTTVGLQNSGIIVAFNILDSIDANDGVFVAEPGCVVMCNTIYSAGRDGIRVDATTNYTTIISNLIHSATTNAINSRAGNTCLLKSAFNMWYNCGAGLTGTPEGYNLYDTGVASADPLPNVSDPPNSVTDFNLATSQKALSFPGGFEAGDYAIVGYLDHGAVQRVEPAGGGGGVPVFGGSVVRRV